MKASNQTILKSLRSIRKAFTNTVGLSVSWIESLDESWKVLLFSKHQISSDVASGSIELQGLLLLNYIIVIA